MPDVTRTVGRFEVLREVGRGGMAVVYLARQNDLDRLVALKELPALHAADSDFAARFLRESRIAGSLSHPNIVTVYDYFDFEGTPYISMEYLERGTLRPFIRSMTLPQVAGVLEGLFAALDHAHARGIVHRDLKPENLLLTRQGSVKVADFGIAKAIDRVSGVHMLTATGATVGTPTYMAPEQAMAREIVPATDLYSVGVMAYEVLVGQVPFADAGTPLAVLLRHVNEAPPPPLSIKPDLDPRLAHWVEALLEKDPRKRPPSAEAAWDTFEELVLSLAGPRWRREARLLEPGEAAPPKPLTPAPFPVSEPAQHEIPGFETYEPDSGATPADAPAGPVRAAEPEPSAALPSQQPAPALESPPDSALPVDDDYRTFKPKPMAEPPIRPPPLPVPEPELAPVPEPEPAEPEPEPEPEPVAPATAERLTLPPSRIPQAQSFEWPAARLPAPARRKLPLAAWLALLVVGGGGFAALAGLLTRGDPTNPAASNSNSTSTSTPTVPVTVPDVTVPLLQQVGLAAAGGRLYLVTPRGYVARLDAQTLAPRAVLSAFEPRSLAFTRGHILSAGAGVVTKLAPGTLAPEDAAALAGASMLAGGDGAPVVAVGTRRVCVVDPRPLACARLGFTPSGVGVVQADSSVVVANAAAGTILHLRRAGAALKPGPAIRVGVDPHGTLRAFRGRLYVAIRRGIAVVDLAGKAKLSVIALPTTAADLWNSPAGMLFATLPASDEVRVVNLTSGPPATRAVKVGHRPQGVAGVGGTVYVANTAAGSVTRLSAATGKPLGAAHRVAALRAPVVSRLVATAVAHRATSEQVVFTIALAGSPARRDVRTSNARIGSGSARILVWGAGAQTRSGGAHEGGAALRIGSAPGRLVLTLKAEAGAFTSLTTSLTGDRHKLVITLHPAPVAQPTPTPPPAPTPTPPPTPIIK